MQCISNIIRSAGRVSDSITSSQGGRSDSDHAIEAKNHVLEVLSRTIRNVDNALQSTQGGTKGSSVADVPSPQNKPAEENLRSAMYGIDAGLSAHVTFLHGIAKDVGVINGAFQGMLHKPYLENCNAISPSAPVVGLRDDEITHARESLAGVASSGTSLTFETLTSSLRSCYIGIHTALYPLINKIQSFTLNHEVFLNKQLQVAHEYRSIDDKAFKHKTAMKEANKLVNQAKIWASIIRTQSNHTNATLNHSLAEFLKSVDLYLKQQLRALNENLLLVDAEIKALPDERLEDTRIEEAFWASIRVILPGMGLLLLQAAANSNLDHNQIDNPLNIGGLVTQSYLQNKPSSRITSELSTRLESELQGIIQAIKDIRYISQKLCELQSVYDVTINQFWRSLFNAVTNLRDMDDATTVRLGEEILSDITAIEAAREVTRNLKSACGAYLAVIRKAGVMIRGEDEVWS
ncbi:hypothetical protein QBC35DRAFT_456878 [Podospora australis]|uniref:Uncharacterized protein n=1 Tax=Podospora australis TaxID=1536484 RepID=A0AAN6WIR2_9PEZI|nr:hypothetical protein QBC35DRAFT_456878 [Podospora australis]